MVAPRNKLSWALLSSDWGHIASVWSDIGLWELSFPRCTIDMALADLKTGCKDLPELVNDHRLQALGQELQLYFRGYQTEFAVPIDWRGYSRFQTAVLRYAATIPYGHVQSYGNVAQAVGSPKAARAVGGALHINRTPIVVPCHRVVGSNGRLTGFGGGVELKKALLLLENEQIICH